jgi:hypothetical protein
MLFGGATREVLRAKTLLPALIFHRQDLAADCVSPHLEHGDAR